MPEISESYRRFRLVAILALSAYTVLVTGIVTGFALDKPEKIDVDGPCEEMILFITTEVTVCGHPDHLIEESGDDRVRCNCATKREGP